MNINNKLSKINTSGKRLRMSKKKEEKLMRFLKETDFERIEGEEII